MHLVFVKTQLVGTAADAPSAGSVMTVIDLKVFEEAT